MTKKVTEKKINLVPNFHGKSQDQKLDESQTIAQKQSDTGYVTTLVPTADEMLHKIADVRTQKAKRLVLITETKTVTQQINTDINTITDTITHAWAAATEAVIGRNVDQAIELGYDIKGIVGGKIAKTKVLISESKLVIKEVENSGHLMHSIFIINSKTNSFILPDDADHVDIYEVVGSETAPISLKGATYLGVVKHGQFINCFPPEMINQVIWYIVVYVPKKKGTPVELSLAVKGVVL